MIFLKLEYAGQNEIDGLNPKIFWVIFFQPLLLDSEHGVRVYYSVAAKSWSCYSTTSTTDSVALVKFDKVP